MCQVGEKRDACVREPQRPVRHVKIRVTLFFDGTRNNARNTESRLAAARNPAARAIFDKYGPGATSYANDYTNVARLRQNTGAEAAGYDYYIRVYVPGIGTTNEQADDRWGYAGGSGRTGIPRRVSEGIARALQLLTTSGDLQRETTVITKLTFDTCGFSRGAAAARHCVHRILHDDPNVPEVGASKSVAAQLVKNGWRIDPKAVEVRAVGLFDTVSSFVPSMGRVSSLFQLSVSGTYPANVEKLRLKAITEAAAVYQLAAAEEYRVHFSLTNIDSAVAAGKGRQVYVPGAHSDVGGSYVDGDREDKVLYWGPGTGDVADFLTRRGWYRGERGAGELVWETTLLLQEPSIRAHRGPISNKYSFVPLRMMASFLREQQIPVLPLVYSRFNPGAIPGRAIAEAGAPRPDPLERVDPVLGALRHDYLHISFDDSVPFAPRLLLPNTNPTGQYRPWRYVASG